MVPSVIVSLVKYSHLNGIPASNNGPQEALTAIGAHRARMRWLGILHEVSINGD
jgi:hypothetical protein